MQVYGVGRLAVGPLLQPWLHAAGESPWRELSQPGKAHRGCTLQAADHVSAEQALGLLIVMRLSTRRVRWGLLPHLSPVCF
jgi:hypothetical protein